MTNEEPYKRNSRRKDKERDKEKKYERVTDKKISKKELKLKIKSISPMCTSKHCTHMTRTHHSDHGSSIKELGARGKRVEGDHQTSQITRVQIQVLANYTSRVNSLLYVINQKTRTQRDEFYYRRLRWFNDVLCKKK